MAVSGKREHDVAYTNLSATDHARLYAGDNYNHYNYNYTIRQRRSDETLRESDRHAAFIQAVVEGQVPRVINFLRMGVDLDETGSGAVDLTALHRAILSGHQDLLQPLIAAGADVNAISVDFGTPLCLAALKGMDSAVELLLQSKAKASTVTEKMGTALHCCVLSVGVHRSTAVALINADAKVSAQAASIDTRWLQAACLWDGDDRSQILPVKKLDGCILFHATPALLAIRTLQGALLEVLLPADLNHTFIIEFLKSTDKSDSARNNRFIREIQQGTVERNIASFYQGYLHSCATLGDLESVRLLVTKGAALDLPSGRCSPLHLAARHGCSEVVDFLIESGAQIGNDRTALHEAAWCSHPNIIRALCDHGVSVDVRTSDGNRPIHEAALNSFIRLGADGSRSLSSLQALIDAGADVNARDGRGRTPLLLTLKAGKSRYFNHEEYEMEPDTQKEYLPINVIFLEKLINEGAETRLRAADDTSVLKLLMTKSMTQSVFKTLLRGKRFDEALVERMYFCIRACQFWKPKCLLEVELINICAKLGQEHLRLITLLGADLDADGSCGWTALHCAAEENDCVAIDRLLAAGALLQPPTAFVTPLAMAAKENRVEAVELLLSRGADPYARRSQFQSAMEIGTEKNECRIVLALREAANRRFNPNLETSSDHETSELPAKVTRYGYELSSARKPGTRLVQSSPVQQEVQSIWTRPIIVSTREELKLEQNEEVSSHIRQSFGRHRSLWTDWHEIHSAEYDPRADEQ